MPNSKQAKKRMVNDQERRAANRSVASRMRSAVKKVLTAPTADDAKKALPEAIKRVDKAAKRSVIHGNAAARKKRQLARAVQSKS